jgi:hypothetical protein
MARSGEAKHRGVFERPRGSGNWWVRYADEHGHIHRERAGPKSLAIRLYTRRRAEVQERRFFPERCRRRDVLLADFIRDYLARVQGTLRSYADLERHGRVWQVALGDRPLRQKVTERLAEYRQAVEGWDDEGLDRDPGLLVWRGKDGRGGYWRACACRLEVEPCGQCEGCRGENPCEAPTTLRLVTDPECSAGHQHSGASTSSCPHP